jgi:formylglycine-generating enzyme required for sulfatase activity
MYIYTSVSGTPGNGSSGLDGLSIDLKRNGYRLPTEAEWEYACRAGSTTEYYWGSASIGSFAWYTSNSGSTTHAAAEKQPNGFGLYDMSGNVWEWCNDWYGGYSDDAQTDPAGASSGSYRVIRGGSWDYEASNMRSSARNYDGPDIADFNFGFRACLPAR